MTDMRRILFFILLLTVITTGCVHCSQPKSAPSPLAGLGDLGPIRKGERILILAPHPDDEAIGCAGIIQKALAAGAEVNVAYLTNGEHNQAAFIVYEKRITLRTGEFIHMGEVRYREAVKAMKLLGLDESHLVFLGYPDFGTFTIFRDFWQTTKPFVSMLTRISRVPYQKNLSYGAPYTGESILADLKQVLKDYRPDKIFVSHPSDTNVDHKAFYLFLEVALSDLEGKIPSPKVYPYLIHCPGWPIPRHYHPDLILGPPRQYPIGEGIRWLESGLTSQELENKHQAILCYKSQTESSAFYLLAFARQNELFGNYPDLVLDLKKETSAKMDMSEDFDSDILKDFTEPQKNKIKTSYEYDGSYFYVRISKADGLSRKFNTLIYLFGYNYKTPFAQMPKIRITTAGNKFKIFDGRKMMQSQGVELSLSSHELALKVPLGLLKDPDLILASLKAYGVKPRIDSIGFHKITIRRK